MVKHVVLFKMKADISNETLLEIKSRLDALVGAVPTLLSAEVGLNGNANEQFHIALTTIHADWAGLKAYAEHPLHVAVAKELIRPNLESRSCVDYEF